MQMNNQIVRAVILAAGKSSKFFPPLYDKPKGLFVFQGEVLIERQIKQLQEAGIRDITVVIGYEKEQFFYLEEKFGVDLIVNTKYADESNLSSLYLAKEKLASAYICCADHWYQENPFNGMGFDRSIRLVRDQSDAIKEFVVNMDSTGRLSGLRLGSDSGLCMMGFAYFDSSFARTFISLYEKEKEYVGVKNLFWEEFWGRHSDALPLFAESIGSGFVELDSLLDLQKMDGDVLENVSRGALQNISELLSCELNEIHDIEPLNKGLTNVSFSFICREKKYVYRHPGASSSNLVNRDTEVFAQNLAIETGIDSSVMAISPEGWKLSRYIETERPFDYDDLDLLHEGISQIKRFHAASIGCRVAYEVNLLEEGARLLKLAANKKQGIVENSQSIYIEMLKLWHHFELDGWDKVLCHNDTYAVNWIVGQDGLCLIDWEYSGMNDPINDIATLVVRDGLDDKKVEEILCIYFEGSPTFIQRRHSYACFALCGWYWYCWALFKDTLNEDGFFMLNSWRSIRKYLPLALSMYKLTEKNID